MKIIESKLIISNEDMNTVLLFMKEIPDECKNTKNYLCKNLPDCISDGIIDLTIRYSVHFKICEYLYTLSLKYKKIYNDFKRNIKNINSNFDEISNIFPSYKDSNIFNDDFKSGLIDFLKHEPNSFFMKWFNSPSNRSKVFKNAFLINLYLTCRREENIKINQFYLFSAELLHILRWDENICYNGPLKNQNTKVTYSWERGEKSFIVEQLKNKSMNYHLQKHECSHFDEEERNCVLWNFERKMNSKNDYNYFCSKWYPAPQSDSQYFNHIKKTINNILNSLKKNIDAYWLYPENKDFFEKKYLRNRNSSSALQN